MMPKRYTEKEMRDAACHVARLLREDLSMMQETAFVRAGVNPRTFRKWLAGDRDEDLMVQSVVLPALHEQAQKNLAAAHAEVLGTEGKLTQWNKWALEKRYRTIFGDLATVQRTEVSGPEGAAIEVRSLSTDEIERRLREIALQATRGDGDDDEA